MASMRAASSATFLSARAIMAGAFSRSITTTPSASPTTRSPGWTVAPPAEMGWLMRPGTYLVGPAGLKPALNTGKPRSSNSSLSRIAPSTITPASPSFLQALSISVPISAAVWSPLPSITSTSPGWARAMAAWIMRLSPGRTSTVKAGPATFMSWCTGATRPCMVPRRPATSARMAAWKVAAFWTTSALTRSMPRMISGSWLMVRSLSCFGMRRRGVVPV